MERLSIEFDSYAADPGRWGYSLVNDAELIVACLDACGARSVVEVGAFAGDLTALLLDWAATVGARVTAIDPEPQEQLVRLERSRAELDLVRATSHAALAEIAPPDAVVIDGDHNYFTVTEELRIVAERAEDGRLPLLLFHDVCWPHARRDDYYDPDAIPAEHRRAWVDGAGLFPGDPGTRPDGLPYRHPAAQEGGPGNGVLTAVEDFAAARALRLAVVPAFFGLGVLWDERAPYAAAVAEVVDPWDRNPLLERLEANRVFQLVARHAELAHVAELNERLRAQEAILRKLLESRTFAVGQALSGVRQRGAPAYSKDEIRRVLGDRG